MVTQEKISVTTVDAVQLKGILLLPEKPKAVVQFNAGTGAKKEFYLSFLKHIAENGYLCCLWDYRGNGESRSGSLKGVDYNMLDYGTKDIPAVKAYLRERFPDLPFLFMGHSAGGQQLGFTQKLDDVNGAVLFAVSTGYLPTQPWRYRLLANYFFYLFTPISIALTGYVASKRFGIMEDLPKQVATQWRAWCSKRKYFFDEKFYGKSVPVGQFENYTFPVKMYWASDDTIANERSINDYWANVKSTAGIDMELLKPEDLDLKKIDHFGFFRKFMKHSLWPKIVQQLDQFCMEEKLQVT